MPRGFQSKQLNLTERIPESAWRYYCDGEIIKTCREKKAYDMFVKYHQKNCSFCKNRKLHLIDTKTKTASGKYV